MQDRIVFYFYRYHSWGFDKITILAFTLEQAEIILKDTVKDFNEWEYSNSLNIDHVYVDNLD